MQRHLKDVVIAFAAAALIVTPAMAQDGMRRTGGGDPPGEQKPLTIRPIPADPEHPFSGVWVGTLKTAFGDSPYTIAIEFLNGEYTGFSAGGESPRGSSPHLKNTVSGKSLRWEQANMGGNGVLIFTAEVVDLNAIKGVMTTRDVKSPAGSPDPGGTFTMKRRLPAK